MADAPPLAPALSQRVVIGVGDMAVSNDGQSVLSTYALGSCIGVVAFDPAANVGGVLHFMLPESGIAPDKARKQPALFADTGLALFFSALRGLSVDASTLQILVAGGASVLGGPDPFKIGERNARATLEFLDRHGYAARHTLVGGGTNRSLHLDLATGAVTLTTPNDGGLYALTP